MYQLRTNQRYQYVIHMIEASSYADTSLIVKFRNEDPNRKKSLYYLIRQASVGHENADPGMDNQKAFRIFVDAVSEYLLLYAAPIKMKQSLYEQLLNWCKQIGEEFNIEDYQIYLDDIQRPFSRDIAVELVKELHSREGISKEELRNKYGLTEKSFQVYIHRLSDKNCSEPLRIGGQAVHVPVVGSESNRKLGKRRYSTPSTLSPLIFQMNIMQVATLLQSLQMNYESGNNIPFDLAVDTWCQLSDYAKERIREVFGQRDPSFAKFLDDIEKESRSDDYRFMTESEMMDIASLSEALDIAYKGGMVCNIALTGPSRNKKNQRIFYDHENTCYYAVQADEPDGERLYFTSDEVYLIEES